MALENLFRPIKLGSVELENRILIPALGLSYCQDGRISDRYRNFYLARARGGAGLIGINASPIYHPSATNPLLCDDDFIPGLREFTDLMHSLGAKVNAQIWSGYGWTFVPDKPLEMVSPSGISTARRADAPPRRPITRGEIHQIVEDMAEGIRRARESGFDLVEVLAGTGYLLSQFLSPFTNRRDDEYGGSLENRARLLLEIVAEGKRRAGADYTLIVRLSGADFLEGGMTLEDTQGYARLLARAGVSAFVISPAWHETPVAQIQMSVPEGAWVYLAQGVKQAVGLPVASVTRISDPVFADRAIGEGRVDMVGMARALIADPELPRKAREGRLEDIIPCTLCSYCFDTLGQPTLCTANPVTGREGEFAIEPAPKKKRVLVVGGGPAGMQAALVASRRGHRVTLMEKAPQLGGQFLLAGLGPYKAPMGRLTRYLVNQVEKSNIRVRLGREVTPQSLARQKPGAIILATGAVPKYPDIPGVKGPNVVDALDVLAGKAGVGQRVVVVGGEMVGCEVTEALVREGKQVALLARRHRVGDDLGRATRWTVLQRLSRAGVPMETGVNVTEITPAGVKALREGKEEFFPADTVVLATGMRSEDRLAHALEGRENLYIIGDGVEPRTVRDALEEGFRAGLLV